MYTTIQKIAAWHLNASVAPTPYGHFLTFTTYVPTARRPEEQVKFAATLSTEELRCLRDVIDQALDVTV